MTEFAVRRGAREWQFDNSLGLRQAIQNGEIDGADQLKTPTTDWMPLAQHPHWGNEIIDMEVIGDDMEDMDVDLTPMIDVTFLLLIFFMATALITMFKAIDAPFSKSDDKGKTRRLPTRSEVAARFLFVTVNSDGSIAVAGKFAAGVDDMKACLEQAMNAEGKRTLVLESDPEVLHGDIIQVIDAANLAGADKILFAKKVGK